MFLKRLELQGFKSFADKTVLDFPSGTTAIVGPNGSGKSNITDAIRWLLGEREARNLRGAKVEDLIFAGSEKRPRVGLAQATLYFDNSSGFFPVDFKEVSISRRIGRDGSSVCLLNKSEVRLKDIIDFFSKSRLGHSGLNIVGQGDSDIFIRATPLERREMIEGLLGLKEYQLKKADAKRRLENTYINLEKANALVEELKPHLRLLKRQVSRYEQREEFAAELKSLENGYYGGKLKSLEAAVAGIEPKLVELDKNISAEQLRIKDSESALEAVRSSQPKANAEINAIQSKKKDLSDRQQVLQKELGKLEARLELASTPTELASAELKTALEKVRVLVSGLARETDIGKIKDGLAAVISVVETTLGDRKLGESNKLNQEKAKLSSDLKLLSDEVDQLAKKETELTAGLQQFNENFKKAFTQLEEERSKLSRLNQDKQKVSFDKERIVLQLDELKRQITEIGRRAEDFKGIAEAQAEDGSATLKRMFRLRSELAGIGEIDESLVKEAKETEERYSFLSREIEDLEKASTDLKSLIKELERKIHSDFSAAMKMINEEFTKFVKLMFGGGRAALMVQEIDNAPSDTVNESGVVVEQNNSEITPGVEVEISLPRKKVKGLDVLSGGERALVSIAALFALISVSPPPFLVMDEVDAALDEQNARRFGELLKDFVKKTQFVVVTHNRATMEAAEVLYGVTMSPDGTSKVVSLKLE
ncbi:MAG: AAA family ATPase [Patescibacteria group bacterium]|nr:AAA family ATPase [Patescibacteria group bacterium]MCL5224459.1 AAA family ATPase [Patescibacteria group bacterium]